MSGTGDDVRAMRWGKALVFASFVFGPSPVWAHPSSLQAHAHYDEELKQRPCDAKLFLQRGNSYRAEGRWNKALADLGRAAKCGAELDTVLLGRGRVLVEAGRARSAKLVLDRLIARAPDHLQARLLRARALVELSRIAAAGVDFARAAALSRRPTPELYLSWVRALVAAEESSEALRVADEGMQRLGPVVSLQQLAIDIEVETGNYDAALVRVEALAGSGLSQASVLARQGEILLLAERPDHARAAFQAAVVSLRSRPIHRRNTQAMQALEMRIRSQLDELEEIP